jgi:hypothetical protein
MRLRLLVWVTAIALAGTVRAEQVCNPVCADQPPECCNIQGGLLVLECAGGGQPHFVIHDTLNTTLTEVSGVSAGFSVAGATVNVTIGNAAFAPFTIGVSENRVRFTTSNGGQCVQVKNFSGFVNPGPIVVDNRALSVSRNAFFCREPARDLICFQVKGQVGAPFPPVACTPDRVEYACGVPVLS